jgi:hypothetical protein
MKTIKDYIMFWIKNWYNWDNIILLDELRMYISDWIIIIGLHGILMANYSRLVKI